MKTSEDEVERFICCKRRRAGSAGSHNFICLTEPKDFLPVHIDEDIFPLIEELWEEQIHTYTCCQGPEDAYVCLGISTTPEQNARALTLAEEWREGATGKLSHGGVWGPMYRIGWEHEDKSS